MEHDCPICGKRIYNHKGACNNCREKIGIQNKSPAGNPEIVIYFILILFLGFILYSAYNFIRGLGFNNNSAISLMISIPLIALILVFRGKKIYRALNSKKKFSPWLLIIILLIVIVLFLQFQPVIFTKSSNSFGNSEMGTLDYKLLCEKDCGGSLKLDTGAPELRGKGYALLESDGSHFGNHILECACSNGTYRFISVD